MHNIIQNNHVTIIIPISFGKPWLHWIYYYKYLGSINSFDPQKCPTDEYSKAWI